MSIYRAWVNQPSALQPMHRFNGKRCIAIDDGGDVIDVWFTDGPIHGSRMPRNCISRCYLSNAPSEHGIYLPKDLYA